jgi:O-antigen ligase
MRTKPIEYSFLILMLLVWLTPFWWFNNMPDASTPKAYYFRVLIELAAPFYTYLIAIERRYRPSLKNPVTICVLGFCLAAMLSTMLGVNVGRSWWGTLERMGGTFLLLHLTLLYFYVLLLGQLKNEWLQRFFWAGIFSAGLIALDGVLVRLHVIGTLCQSGQFPFCIPEPHSPRVSAMFGNPIFFASFLILPVFLTAYFALRTSVLWLRIVCVLVLVVEVVSIFLTQTRGAVYSLALGLIAFASAAVVGSCSRRIKLAAAALLPVVVLLIGFLFLRHDSFAHGSVLNRVSTLEDGGSRARLIQWQAALRAVPEHTVFGVGPENYYVIGAKHYDPAIYQYDREWFDKPHNYLVELLVTQGTLGIAWYLGLILLSFAALYRSYKYKSLSWLEFCLLSAGLLVYQLQNFFIFETVSASLMLWLFVGLAGFLWHGTKLKQTTLDENQGASPRYRLPLAASSLVLMVCLFGVYVTVVQIRIINNLMLARAAFFPTDSHASPDPVKADAFFQKALSLPYNPDPVESANRYALFAMLFPSLPGADGGQAQRVVAKAVAVERAALQEVSNDARAWHYLAKLYLVEAAIRKQPRAPLAEDAIQHVIELAPRHPESWLEFVRIKLNEGDLAGAEGGWQKVIEGAGSEAIGKMRLALVYRDTNYQEQGLKMAEDALAAGYQPVKGEEIAWLAGIYAEHHQFQKAAVVLEKAALLSPRNWDIIAALAETYAATGHRDQAVQLALAVERMDSRSKPWMNAVLQYLGANPAH